MRRRRKNTEIGIVLVLVACLLAIGGPLLLIRRANIENQSKGNSKWPKVKGLITNSEVVRSSSSGSGGGKRGHHRVRSRLTYRYFVDGKEYTSHRYAFGRDGVSDDDSLARRYPIGREVDVYYAPKNPGTSVLKRGEFDAELSWMITAFGALMSVVGWGLLGLILLSVFLRRRHLASSDRESIGPESVGRNRGVFSTRRPTRDPPQHQETERIPSHASDRMPDPLAAASGGHGLVSKVFSRVGFSILFILGLLVGYVIVNQDPPVIRQLRAEGCVVSFANEDFDFQPRGGRNRKQPWRNSQVYAIQIFEGKDLRPLAKHTGSLTNLQRLELRGTQVHDLAPLAALQNLERLDLSGTQVADLTPLARLKKLRWLTLTDTQVQDLAPLSELKALDLLILTNTSVRDLTPLANLKSLSSLHFDHTQVGDLTPLAELKRLGDLHIGGAPVRDLSPLIDHPRLASLGLDEMQVRVSLPVLASFQKLKRLDLRGTRVTDAELANIQAALPQCSVLPQVSE